MMIILIPVFTFSIAGAIGVIRNKKEYRGQFWSLLFILIGAAFISAAALKSMIWH